LAPWYFHEVRSLPLVIALVTVSSTLAHAQDEEDEPGAPRVRAEPAPPAIDRPFRLGLNNEFSIGFAGQMKNPSPAYDLMADFAFPTGRKLRYHFLVGFRDLNGWNGVRVSPLTLGFDIPVRQQFLPPELSLEVEVLFTVVQADALFGSELYNIALSSGVRARLLLNYEDFFASLTPIGLEIGYAYGTKDVGIQTSFGAQWPIHLAIGVNL
jgi:hypothetical protein